MYSLEGANVSKGMKLLQRSSFRRGEEGTNVFRQRESTCSGLALSGHVTDRSLLLFHLGRKIFAIAEVEIVRENERSQQELMHVCKMRE